MRIEQIQDIAGDAAAVESITVGAIVFAQTKTTFTPRQFSEFLQMAGVVMDEETADEFLSDLADRDQIRQIGPGIYAAKASG